MNPQLASPWAVDVENPLATTARLSDMRRVSLSLAFAPTRHRRRRRTEAAGDGLTLRMGARQCRGR